MKNCLIQTPVFVLLRTALWAALGMVCFTSVPAMAGPVGRDVGCSPTLASPCSGGPTTGGGGGRSGGHIERLFSEDPEKARVRKETVQRYNSIFFEANAAVDAGNYDEAARLYRKALQVHEPLGETKHSRETREYLEHLEGVIKNRENIRLGDDYNQKANKANADGDYKLALRLYKQALATYSDPSSKYRQEIAEYEKYVEQKTQAEQERIKKEEKAAKLERRHRPEVEQLRTEARAMMDQRPAEALANLDTALKLLPDDPKTKGDWWLAKASLALHEGKYDEALQAVKNAKSYSGDSPEITKAQTRIADERNRQGANVQIAFNDLRQRLAAAPSVDTAGDAFGTKKSNPTLPPREKPISGSNTSAGAQAKSAERHGREAQLSGNEAASETARMGFDTSGKASGNLVYPDKKQQQIPPTALDRQVPVAAQKDPQIQQSLAWYRKLDAQKAEKEKMIAEIKEQQKTSKDPVLETKIATLKNEVIRATEDQAKVTETVKKQVKNLGFNLVESPLPATTDTQNSVKAPEPSKLDFIRN